MSAKAVIAYDDSDGWYDHVMPVREKLVSLLTDAKAAKGHIYAALFARILGPRKTR